jgi:hypothetical protein
MALDPTILRKHQRKILCGLVDFYFREGYTQDAYRDPETGGVYEHKLATMLGYELRPEGSPPLFLEACRLLEEQGFVVRRTRKADVAEKGIWPTLKGLEQAEFWDARPVKRLRLFIAKYSATITASLALIISLTALFVNYLNTIRSERAYVSGAPSNIFNLSPGNGLQAYVRISNSGKTLGRATLVHAGVAIRSTLPDRLEEIGPMQAEPGTFVAWPNDPYVTYRNFGTLPEADFQAVVNAEKRIFVFGKVEYDDVFNNRRTTIFCHVYFGSETADFPRNGGRGYHASQARPCDKHNSAD